MSCNHYNAIAYSPELGTANCQICNQYFAPKDTPSEKCCFKDSLGAFCKKHSGKPTPEPSEKCKPLNFAILQCPQCHKDHDVRCTDCDTQIPLPVYEPTQESDTKETAKTITLEEIENCAACRGIRLKLGMMWCPYHFATMELMRAEKRDKQRDYYTKAEVDAMVER